jgi:signal transduction histidine kinase
MIDVAALRLPPTRAEVLLATGAAVLGLGEVWVPFSSRQGSGSAVAATVGVVLVAVTLLWSRRQPIVPLLCFPVIWGLIGLIAPTYLLFYGQMVPLEVAVFMAARFGRGRTPLYAAIVAAVCLLGIDVFVSLMQDPGEITFHWTVTALVWSAGFGLRTLDRRAKASLRRAVDAEVGAAEQAMRAVLEERSLIARELHDIVAHAVSSMVVQAGAVESGADDPAYVRSTAGSIRATGQEALAEMRRLVSVLRVSDDAPFSPQPRLEALPALVEQASVGGTQVELSQTGEARALPAGLDLAIYRIVQEALTNVRKHSGAGRCTVCLEYRSDCVRVSVVDDGPGTAPASGSPGHGLVGMRERVRLYGGDLTAGPEGDTGFAVRATLPVAR